MAQPPRDRKESQRVVAGRFDLVGAPGPRPELRIDVIDPKGKRSRVELGKQGEIRLDAGQLGKGFKVEVRAAGRRRAARIHL